RDVEPLEREIANERLGALVGEHAPHLLLHDARRAEAPGLGKLEQLLIRQAAPEEEGQPRRQLEIAELDFAFAGAGLGTVDEVRARQNGGKRVADADFEATLLAAGVVERHQAAQILVRDRAAERAL